MNIPGIVPKGKRSYNGFTNIRCGLSEMGSAILYSSNLYELNKFSEVLYYEYLSPLTYRRRVIQALKTGITEHAKQNCLSILKRWGKLCLESLSSETYTYALWQKNLRICYYYSLKFKKVIPFKEEYFYASSLESLLIEKYSTKENANYHLIKNVYEIENIDAIIRCYYSFRERGGYSKKVLSGYVFLLRFCDIVENHLTDKGLVQNVEGVSISKWLMYKLYHLVKNTEFEYDFDLEEQISSGRKIEDGYYEGLKREAGAFLKNTI